MDDISDDMKEQITKDLYKHKILVFKNQTKLTPQRHIGIVSLFGDKLDRSNRVHKKAPDDRVYRVGMNFLELYANDYT